MSHLRLSQIIGTIGSPSHDIRGAPISTNDKICRIFKGLTAAGESVYDYYTEDNMNRLLRVIESRKQPGDPVFYHESDMLVPGAYNCGRTITHDVGTTQIAFRYMNGIYPTSASLDDLDTFIVNLLPGELGDSSDYTVMNNQGQTLLTAASIKGLHRTVSAIIGVRNRMYVDIDAQDDYGDTALICACKNNNAHIVWLLLEAGANKKITNRDGKTCVDSIPGTPEECRAIRTILSRYPQRAGYKKRRRTNVRKNHRKNTRKVRH